MPDVDLWAQAKDSRLDLEINPKTVKYTVDGMYLLSMCSNPSNQAKATGCSSAECSMDDAVNKDKEAVAFQNAKRQKMKKAGVQE